MPDYGRGDKIVVLEPVDCGFHTIVPGTALTVEEVTGFSDHFLLVTDSDEFSWSINTATHSVAKLA